MDEPEPLISTRDRPGLYDGLISAKPGEPIFVLQGGDPFAPPSIASWVTLMREAGLAEADKKKAAAMLRKATAAEQVIWAMKAYQRGEVAVTSTGRDSYSGWKTDEAGEAALERRDILIKGADKLHNSLAEALLIADALAKLREFPEAEVRIREAVAMLKESALDIEPRRHLRR